MKKLRASRQRLLDAGYPLEMQARMRIHHNKSQAQQRGHRWDGYDCGGCKHDRTGLYNLEPGYTWTSYMCGCNGKPGGTEAFGGRLCTAYTRRGITGGERWKTATA